MRAGPLTLHLQDIHTACEKGELTLKRLFEIFGRDGHYVAMFFMSLPFLQPMPTMGLSAPFAVLIGMVAVAAHRGREAWIPARWKNKILPSKLVLKIVEAAEVIFRKVEKYLHPRWPGFFNPGSSFFSLVLLLYNAFLLALPIPLPFANSLPAWGVLFFAVANLERDGLFIALLYVQSVLCTAFFVALYLGAVKIPSLF